MNRARRRDIDQLAGKVREALDLAEIPVRPVLAIERLGGSVRHSQVSGPDGTEADACVRKHGDEFIIELNSTGDSPRDTFSLAHEVGHLFLHMGYLVSPEKWNRATDYHDSVKYRYGYSEEELEAHEFAGAFLMPVDDYRSFVQENASDGQIALAIVAEHFGVSRQASLTRGRWLGLFEWDE